jgi:hypothetical protein
MPGILSVNHRRAREKFFLAVVFLAHKPMTDMRDGTGHATEQTRFRVCVKSSKGRFTAEGWIDIVRVENKIYFVVRADYC